MGRGRYLTFTMVSFLVATVVGVMVWRGMVAHTRGWSGIVYQGALSPDEERRIRSVSIGYSSNIRSLAVLVIAPGSPAAAAGILPGDTILSVNGISTRDSERLRRLDAELRTGDAVDYQLARGGKAITRSTRLVSPFSIRQVLFSSVASLLVALAFLCISAFVFLMRRNDERALVFYLLFTIGGAFFLVGTISESEASAFRGIVPVHGGAAGNWIVIAVYTLLSLLMTTLLLHFAVVFPRRVRLVEQYPLVLRFIHLLPFVFLLSIGATGFVIDDDASMSRVAAVLCMVVVAAGCGTILARVARERDWLAAFATRPLTGQLFFFSTIGVLFALLATWAQDEFVLGIFVAIYCAAGFMLTIFGYAVASCVVLFISYRRSAGEERRQLRWPLWGAIVGIGGSSLVGLLVLVSTATETISISELPAWSTAAQILMKLFYVLIPIGFAFGILKYRLMEIDVVFRKTVVYSVASGIVLFLYFGIVAGVGQLLMRTTGVRNQTVTIIGTLVVAALFIPLRNRVQAFVDKWFFRRRSDYLQVLRRFAERVATFEREDEVHDYVADQTRTTLQVRSTVLFARSIDETLHLSVFAGEVPASAPAAGWLKPEVISAGVPAETMSVAEIQVPEEDRKLLEELGIEVVVPIREKGRLLALLCVGPRQSEEPFGEEEREFLASVAERTALALEKLRLRAEELEFRQAQQIQQSLLPSVIPQVEGCEIAGLWQPARAVGGDYYDVIPLRDGSVAVCIGDVVGKGLPAALLMASLQSAVRAVSTPDAEPREVCERVRKVVVANLARGKFITFFYCVIDMKRRHLSYANCGHNAPVLMRADGTALRLDVGGAALARLFTPLPLEEATVELRSGDRLLLFTDGVSEASDGDGLSFGEERLTDLVRDSRELSAAALVRRVVDRVTGFSAGNLQDDVTMASVSVL